MVLYIHELKQGRRTFLLWTLAMVFFMAMCIFLYPEMKGQMANVSKMFSSMGFFTSMFGMDRLDFGTLMGYYAIECGNIISMGGAFFVAVIAVNMLSKEEKDHTAEYLLAHPQSRARIQISKLGAMLTQLAAMHAVVFVASVISIRCIGEDIAWRQLAMLHLACFLSQIEIGMICYAISAFSRGNNFGVGLGLTMALYFMSLLANVSKQMKAFHAISPFGYAEGAGILTDGRLDWRLIALGMAIGAVCLAIGCMHYQRKDIY